MREPPDDKAGMADKVLTAPLKNSLCLFDCFLDRLPGLRIETARRGLEVSL